MKSQFRTWLTKDVTEVDLSDLSTEKRENVQKMVDEGILDYETRDSCTVAVVAEHPQNCDCGRLHCTTQESIRWDRREQLAKG